MVVYSSFIFHLKFFRRGKTRFVPFHGTHQGNYVLDFDSASCSSFKSAAKVEPTAHANPMAAHAGGVTAGSEGTAATVAEAARYSTAAKANPAKTAAASLRVKLTIFVFTSVTMRADTAAEPQT
jgi:hypothetical protein